jgi:hypothetical protein
MKKRETNRREALLRMKQFLTDHPLTQPNARVVALQNAISAVVAEIDAHGDDQETGRGMSRGGTADCRRIATELRMLMHQISDISKVMDPQAFPGIAQQLRMPGNSYVSLETRARAFVEVVMPIKAEFVDRMMPASFAEDLQEMINAFVRARERKYSGRAEQVGGTAGIGEAIRRGMRFARELDAILSVAYAKTPAPLAAWKNAARPRRDPESSAIATSPAAHDPIEANAAELGEPPGFPREGWSFIRWVDADSFEMRHFACAPGSEINERNEPGVREQMRMQITADSVGRTVA